MKLCDFERTLNPKYKLLSVELTDGNVKSAILQHSGKRYIWTSTGTKTTNEPSLCQADDSIFLS